MKIPVVKMTALGNNYVIIEDLESKFANYYRELALRLSDKNFGIGSDGLLVITKGDKTYRMRIFNPDGSEAEMCGNGIRMVARLLFDEGKIDKRAEIEVGYEGNSRIVEVFIVGDSVGVSMGKASIEGDLEIRVKDKIFLGTKVSLGNPHFVIFFDEEIKALQVLKDYAPLIEKHEAFPNRTNVDLAHVKHEKLIFLHVWERGAGATMACGSGACATALVANKLGLVNEEVEVKLPGGKLYIRINRDDTLFMKGPVQYVLKGEAYVVGIKGSS